MNEQELRVAMRATMASATVPPPMNETLALDVARRAARRRRAGWAGAGSAAAAIAVVGVAVLVVAVVSGADGFGGIGSGGVAPGSGTTSTTEPGDPSGTKTSWPNGQTDRTARSGPEFDNGEALLGELAAVVPAGFDAPEYLRYEDPAYSGGPLRASQAQYEDTAGGTQVWEYMAELPVTKGSGVGRLLVQVTTPGNGMKGDGCALPSLWGIEGTCVAQQVGGRRVGVFSRGGDRDDFDSWAAFRHEDGTVVYVAQSAKFLGSAKPPLAQAPMTARQLAELAADDRFRLG